MRRNRQRGHVGAVIVADGRPYRIPKRFTAAELALAREHFDMPAWCIDIRGARITSPPWVRVLADRIAYRLNYG